MFLHEKTHRYHKNDYQFFDALNTKDCKIRGTCNLLTKVKLHELEWSSFFNADFRIAAKNWEKKFCFLHNFIWIGFGKFSLLQKEYLSSSINALTNSPKISDITKRDFWNLSFLKVMKKYDKSTVLQI